MRERVAEVRLREGQEPTETMLLRTYNTAMSTAAAEVIERWAAGRPAPVPDGHLEVVKAIAPDGKIVGFNVYLLWGEPRRLGDMKSEPA